MRVWIGRGVEGAVTTHTLLRSRGNAEPVIAAMGTYPFLAAPAACGECIQQCPVTALELLEGAPA